MKNKKKSDKVYNCPECKCIDCYKTDECGTDCNNPYKINYKHTSLPISRKEKLWLIFFTKTVRAMETYLPDIYDDNVFEDLLEKAYWIYHIKGLEQWEDPRSSVNQNLNEYREQLEYKGVDWKRIQDYKLPIVKTCNYDFPTGHDLCPHKESCKLRS